MYHYDVKFTMIEIKIHEHRKITETKACVCMHSTYDSKVN